MSVRLYPINVKTAEPIGPTFFVGSRVTQGEVYRWSNFQKYQIFENFENPRILFYKIRDNFFLQFTQREHVHNGNGRWARTALTASFFINCVVGDEIIIQEPLQSECIFYLVAKLEQPPVSSAPISGADVLFLLGALNGQPGSKGFKQGFSFTTGFMAHLN